MRDAVVLEVWEESVSGFQEPLICSSRRSAVPIRPSACASCVRAASCCGSDGDDDCSAVAVRGQDDFGAKLGKLTVTPAPALVIAGDCPVDAGGGYTGFEHYLYRIEIAEPNGRSARASSGRSSTAAWSDAACSTAPRNDRARSPPTTR